MNLKLLLTEELPWPFLSTLSTITVYHCQSAWQYVLTTGAPSFTWPVGWAAVEPPGGTSPVWTMLAADLHTGWAMVPGSLKNSHPILLQHKLSILIASARKTCQEPQRYLVFSDNWLPKKSKSIPPKKQINSKIKSKSIQEWIQGFEEISEN